MSIKFRERLALLLLALFVLVQVPTFVAFYYATRQSALSQAQTRLASGARVFADLLQTRGAQLEDAVRITTSDFGFKQAVATGDTPTIHSVLYNQGHRISADLMVLTSLDGRVVAALDANGKTMAVGDWTALVAHAGEVAGTTVTLIDGRPYQLVIVPVRAPTRIAWVGMGFALDDALARSLKDLAGVEVTFLARDRAGHRWLRTTLSALDDTGRRALFDATGSDNPVPRVLSLGPQDYFTQWKPLQGDDGMLGALLQFSRSEALATYRSLEHELLLIALLSLVASLGGALWLSRNVTRPVSLLADAARRIGHGDYLGTVPVQHNDELGELAHAFNGMQRGIARREQQIAHAAFHDNLTALPNRASLQQSLVDALVRAAGAGHTLAVLMLDVDRFKEINDTMGHGIGDRVLVEIGRRLRSGLRDDDVLARFGGDEFVVLMEGIHADDLMRRAEELLDAVAQPIRADAMELFLDVSVGMALFPEHGDVAEELLRRADIAMYDAKEARARLQLYRPGRDAEHLYRLSLVNDLRRAVPNNELELHYQPKLQLCSQRVLNVEALLRWRHPQHGLIPPDDFIALAEHSGIIRSLTDWVLHEVIRQCAEWSAQGMDIGVALNLSAMDLGSGELPDVLARHLATYGIDPGRLVLEVTETAVMRDALYSLEVLNRLKACGVMLAIDDFGTGYSSLSHLKRLPVDELKIDKSFVMGMAEDEDDAVIVRSTIELAHNMGLKVVAEGVETDAAMQMLRGFRCDSAQGYLISRPMPAADATRWLADACAEFAARPAAEAQDCRA
ncbi:putative bifunctional diguanylate cyclase/phosphodiesterase [Dyella sp.]|jgi:diguanylate cyclase (GGDEF)-like protein|uniref:putative bifunctional diguanylate cyclase/phosphodiesterase n=1 Tax=Dyella sp. TaxID=1869338 RepID=UPI002D79A5FC|nr:EAL domain-containing protein [Dyella sp.]HET6431294.1 EAL domain-containing protein [Dyella sp.]